MITNVVTDTFGRTVASGWGNADTGQTYTASGVGGTVSGTDTSVGSGTGKHSIPVANAFRQNYLAGVSQADVDLRITGSIAALPTGARLEVANLFARYNGVDYYMFRAQVETSGAVAALIFAPDGTQLASATVGGLIYVGGMQLAVRAQAVGSLFRMKVWRAADPEPLRWLVSTWDYTRTTAGSVGVRSGRAAGNTNTSPVVFTYDTFTVGTPSADPTDFPDADLDMRVYAAFGADLTAEPSTWQYTDISGWLLNDAAQVKDGRGDGSETPEPATFSCTLDNDDGRFTKGHPLSPYWPYVRKNTPILVQVDPDVAAPLFDGYAVGWQPSYSVWAQKPTVTLSAAGALQRIQQGKKLIQSVLRRAALDDAVVGSAAAYWPMEDGSDATQFASGLPGGPAMTMTGLDSMSPGSYDAYGGSAPIATFKAGGNISGVVPATVDTTGAIYFRTLLHIPASNSIPAGRAIIHIAATGTVAHWFLLYDVAAGGSLEILGVSSTGVTLEDTGSLAFGNINDQDAFLAWELVQSGSDINWNLLVTNLAMGFSGLVASGPFIGRTLGRATTFSAGGQGTMTDCAMGHVGIANNPAWLAWDPQLLNGWLGEQAHERIARLGAEEKIPVQITGTSSAAMGSQETATLMEIWQDCEDADGGHLFDGASAGIGYITRDARYNRSTRLTVDYSTFRVTPAVSDGDVVAPVDDDQQSRNLWAVSRSGGSSAVAADLDGPEGVSEIGLYDSSAELNVATDDDLLQQAAWRVHLGTVSGLRYPKVTVDLAANPELLADWQQVALLDRITQANVPGHYPGSVDVAVVGRQQTVSRRSWVATVNCDAYEPWSVGVVEGAGDPALPFRLDTGGSVLAAAASAGAGSLLVATQLDSVLWTTSATYPADFPPTNDFDIEAAGLQVPVTAIASAVTDTFTRTVGAGSLGIADTGQSYTLDGTGSDFSVSSGAARIATTTINVLNLATVDTGSADHRVQFTQTLPVVPTGAAITLWAFCRYTNGSNYLAAFVNIATSGAATIFLIKFVAASQTVLASGVASIGTHGAGNAWTIVMEANGTTVRARAWNASTGADPKAWQVSATDTTFTTQTRAGFGCRRESSNSNGSQTIVVDNFTVPNPQAFTVTGAAVLKALPAGTAVSLWRPAPLAL